MRGSSGDISPVLARINLRPASVAGQEAVRYNRDNFVRSRFRSEQRRNDIGPEPRFTRLFFQIAYSASTVRRDGSTGTIGVETTAACERGAPDVGRRFAPYRRD